MGYTTEFNGKFGLTNPVSDELMDYINRFSNTRHMKLDVEMVKQIDPDWRIHCFNGEMGEDGMFWVTAETTDYFYDRRLQKDGAVKDFNYPPVGVPGLYCQWIMNDNQSLEWDGGEKFYDYVEWAEFLNNNFFKPNGTELVGTVKFRGEDFDDVGEITFVEGGDKCIIKYFF